MGFSKIRTALIGSGMISEIYLTNLTKLDIIELVGCSDIIAERSKKRAEEFNIRSMTNEEIFSDPSIELIINTTYPLSHYEIARKALEAGKSVYTEKMVCETVGQVSELMQLAKRKNLFFGAAPDTFFSGGIQLARRIIDSGIIGKPVAAQAFLSRSYHHERHYLGEEKRFAFCRHGGIVFDMGAYYFTTLVFLLGAVKNVTGFVDTREAQRIYQNPNGALYGKDMIIESPNVTSGTLLFEDGVMAAISFLSESVTQNHFCIYCTDGMIDLGDPNEYEGSIRIINKRGEESVLQSPFGLTAGNFRGYGAAEGMYSLRDNRTARCSGELARHVLEIALGLCESSQSASAYQMKTDTARPAPFAPGHTEYPELALKIR